MRCKFVQNSPAKLNMDDEHLLPASSQFFPAGENWMIFGINASSVVHSQQAEQQGSTAESLLTQLGHLPSQLNTSSSLVVPRDTVSSCLPPQVQLARQNRSCSTPEQFHLLRQSAAGLHSASNLSIQFLEPPNSHAGTVQFTHPALMATAVAPAGMLPAAANDAGALRTGASIPNSSSFVRPGVPVLKLEHLLGNSSSTTTAQQQQPTDQQQQMPAHPMSSSRRQSAQSTQSAPGSAGRGQQHNSNSPGKPPSTAGSHQHTAEAAADQPQGGAAAELQQHLDESDLQLAAMQAELNNSQQQLLQFSTQLAAAEQAKAALQEQLEHLGVKARSQESQLEFAHQQLDLRQQELRAQAAALEASQRSTQQLHDTMHSLNEELSRRQQEAEEVSRQQQGDASEARRLAEEAGGLQEQLAKLTAELTATQRELADTRQQLQQLQHLQGSNGRRMLELEGDTAQLTQQLTVVNERAALLEAQNKRLNEELIAAEVSHNRLTQQLAAADLQNSKLSQQLSSNEVHQSRFNQQLSTADAQNAKLLQQLSAAEGETAALRSEVTLLQASRQQADATCEQMRQLQQDAQRHIGQLRNEVAQASQEVMTLRSQNDTLSQRLSAADCSNAALQSGLDKSWQSARAADRAAQEAKQQLLQAQHQILQLRQQLSQQQSSAMALPAAASGFGLSGPLSQQPAGLQMTAWPDKPAADSLGYGALDSSRPRYESTVLQAGSVYSSQEWQGSARSLGACADAAPWAAQQQQQPGAYSNLSNSPNPGDRPPVPRMGPGQQQEPAGSRSSVDASPWFAGGGGRVGSSQQINSHVRTAGSPDAQGPGAPAAASGSWQAQQRPESRQQQQQPVSANALQVQASAADLGFSAGSQLALSRDMMSVVEVMAATKQLEDQLLSLCQERDELDKELAKMPVGAGRTIKGRQRKMVVEGRLDDLGVEISKVRTQIKQMSGNIKR